MKTKPIQLVKDQAGIIGHIVVCEDGDICYSHDAAGVMITSSFMRLIADNIDEIKRAKLTKTEESK